jgi:hypothetical protein
MKISSAADGTEAHGGGGNDLEFASLANPSREVCESLSRLDPRNPFITREYLAARGESGTAVWMLGLRRGAEWVAGCAAFLSTGRLNRSLEIESYPLLGPGETVFNAGLAAFCEQQGVSRLALDTFGSPAGVSVARFPGETSRVARKEFLLDLRAAELWPALASNHKRRVKAAEKAGITIRGADESTAVREHVQLIEATFDRRKERGETVPEEIDPAPLEAFVASGAARIFQACLAGRVLSSILVLRSPAAGYYQTAGNSPEGLSAGASHLLLYRVAQTLQSESAELFNLGGVSEHNPGLVRFKESFGAAAVELEAAEFDVGPAWKKAVTSMAGLVRRGSATFRKLGSAKS